MSEAINTHWCILGLLQNLPKSSRTGIRGLWRDLPRCRSHALPEVKAELILEEPRASAMLTTTAVEGGTGVWRKAEAAAIGCVAARSAQ